jgi:hypothetical protein
VFQSSGIILSSDFVFCKSPKGDCSDVCRANVPLLFEDKVRSSEWSTVTAISDCKLSHQRIAIYRTTTKTETEENTAFKGTSPEDCLVHRMGAIIIARLS